MAQNRFLLVCENRFANEMRWGKTTGMEKMNNATNIYIRSVSKRKEQDDKEKMLPLDSLSQSLIYHGEEFEHDSTFGTCLTSKSVPAYKILLPRRSKVLILM